MNSTVISTGLEMRHQSINKVANHIGTLATKYKPLPVTKKTKSQKRTTQAGLNVPGGRFSDKRFSNCTLEGAVSSRSRRAIWVRAPGTLIPPLPARAGLGWVQPTHANSGDLPLVR